jgi:hypothetical protein
LARQLQQRRAAQKPWALVLALVVPAQDGLRRGPGQQSPPWA